MQKRFIQSPLNLLNTQYPKPVQTNKGKKKGKTLKSWTKNPNFGGQEVNHNSFIKTENTSRVVSERKLTKQEEEALTLSSISAERLLLYQIE